MNQDKQKQNLPSIIKNINIKSKVRLPSNPTISIHSTRSISAFTAYRKYENVQKISNILQDLQSKQIKKESKRLNKQQNLHQRVIDTFKQKIRTSFNQLYDGYDINKEIINKQIKQLEKNKTIQFEMNNRFQQTLKQKMQYDKVKADVQTKRKKLEKLKQVLKKEQQFKFESQELKQELDERIAELISCENKREELDYQKAVLLNMRFERRNLRRIIKQRFNDRWKNWVDINQKIDKFWNEAQGKKLLLKKIASKLPSDDPQIPQHLAHELERVIQQFYGKQAFLNIFHHQNIKNQEANRKQLIAIEEEKENQRKIKQQHQREQKRQYEIIEQQYLLRKNQEEKIRKVCAVNNLNEIAQNPLITNQRNLKELKESFQIELENIKAQNTKIRQQIQQILSRDSKNQQNLRSIMKSYEQQHEQQRKIFNQLEKCNKFLENLEIIIERVTQQNGTKKQLNLRLAAFSSKYEKYTVLQKIQSQTLKLNKDKILKKDNRQNDSAEINEEELKDEKEYLDEQFKNRKVE